jgi:hypothetical protein
MGISASSCSREVAGEWLEKPGAAEACPEANPARQCFRRARSSAAHRALIQMICPGWRGRLLWASVAHFAVEPTGPQIQMESPFLVPTTTARPHALWVEVPLGVAEESPPGLSSLPGWSPAGEVPFGLAGRLR